MGCRSSKPVKAFLEADFPADPAEQYYLGPVCRESEWGTSRRAVERATGGTFMAEYCREAQTEREIECLASAWSILRVTDHPNMLKFHQVFRLREGCYVFVVGNYQIRDLFDVIAERTEYDSQMSEEEARENIIQLLHVLEYLHSQGIVHRDLKPELVYYQDEACSRILLHPGFFCAALSEAAEQDEWCGTVCYLAPEMARNEHYNTAVDCWSLGVIVYVMLTGYMPIVSENDSDSETLELVKEGEYAINARHWTHRSKEAVHFVKRLMTVNPRERMNCSDALRHPWILETLLQNLDEPSPGLS